MAKFCVYGSIVGTKYLGVFEAATKEEAEEKALHDAEGPSLCHQCSDECEDPEIESVTAELIEDEDDK
ncbi:hypothetical protein ACRAVF_19240 [Bradyrhizobium oligotrophicum S58]